MQTSYRRLVNFNETVTLKASNDKVTVTYHSFLEHWENEYYYKDLSGKTSRGRIGDSKWSSIGWTLVAAPFFLYIFIFVIFAPDLRRAPIALAIYTVLLICGILAFIMRLVKDDWIWFFDKKGEVALYIKIEKTRRDEAEKFIAYIKERIGEQS